jgi:hypothetical protein
MKSWLSAMLLCLAFWPSLADAQVDRATLSGAVRDSSNAVIPKARVTLTHLTTGVTVTVATTGEGAYLATNLAPGEWAIEAEAPGFQRFAETVRLDVGQRARLDFTLTVGGIEQTVRVEGVKPLLNTESAVLGSVVDQNFIAKLPLAIRNWDDLLALVAGVQGDRYTEESGGGTSAGRTGGVNVHGIRSLQNNFLLDGVDNNSISENVQELSTQVSRPSVDAINEFKVVTSPYSAEFGRSPGAAVSVSTKSGTNALRGTAYEYYRNAKFDSISFFANRAGQPKPDNNQNQYGANLGGPLQRDRAFFFFDFEGTRIAKGTTHLTHVPTLDERNGIFTSTIVDPLTGLPFPNNTIPASRIDPVGQKLLSYFPAPNIAGANNFIRLPNVEDRPDRYTTRIDLHSSQNDNVFGRYIYTNRFRFIPGDFGGIADGTSSSSGGSQQMNSHGFVLGWTKVLSGSAVNEFRLSWARARSTAAQEPLGLNTSSALGLKGVPDDPRYSGGLPGTSLSSCCRIGSADFHPKFQNTDQFEYLDTLSKVAGSHQVKVGVDLMMPMKDTFLDIPATRGSLTFNGRFTGNSVADALLGYVQAAQISTYYEVNQRHWATSFFAQDDWKAASNLSINLGLRYDFITPALEAQNRITNFDPATGTVIVAKDGSFYDRGLVHPDTNNVAPRLGLVYNAAEHTVLRAGYGIFYNLFDRIGSEDQLALNPPGLINNSVNTNSTTTPVFFLKDGFPVSFLTTIDYSRIRLRVVDQNAQKTFYHQISGGLEHQLSEALVVSADVTTTLGRNISLLRNLNQPLNGSGPKPYPAFGDLEYRENKGTSTYNGLDLTFERRFHDGYSYRFAYTLSKSTDEAPEHLSNGGSGGQQDTNNLAAWEGPSDFDTRHRFVTTVVAELPFGKGKPLASEGVGSAILGGWLVSGIYTARTGRPFTVVQGTNNVGSFATGLPNRVGDGTLSDPTVDKWFDPSAFVAVPSGTFGNSSRNILRGPGWITIDMSLQRRIALGRPEVTLRWDVFNLLNRANFSLPNRDIANKTTVGTITSLAGDARIMQFSMRVGF